MQTLLQGVILEACADGVERPELFVDTENHRAIAVYESQGFQRVAIHPDGVRIDGLSQDGHFYIFPIPL